MIMADNKQTLNIVWTKQGTINWEDWWVKGQGHKLDKIPGLKDHISFADFDLKRNGCPLITVTDDGLEIRDISADKLETVERIIHYHGFSLKGKLTRW
jgi:hypothetical protein